MSERWWRPMLFDCGHKDEIGRFHREGLLCLACSNAGYPRQRRFPAQSVMPSSRDRETEFMEALSLIKKRLPSDWPDEKLEKIARHLMRFNVRGGPGVKTGAVKRRSSLKSGRKGI